MTPASPAKDRSEADRIEAGYSPKEWAAMNRAERRAAVGKGRLNWGGQYLKRRSAL